MQLSLSTPIRYVPKIGPVMADRLGKLEIFTVRDFLYHIPFRYEDFSVSKSIHAVSIGKPVHIIATVRSIRTVYTKKGKQFQECIIYDDNAEMNVIWFNQSFLTKVIKPGDVLSFAGTAGFYGASKAFISPIWEQVISGKDLLSTSGIISVYPSTEGVTSKWMRARIHAILQTPELIAEDPLPDSIKHTHNLVSLRKAIQDAHFPPTLQAAESAKNRLAFDELLHMHCRAKIRKYLWKTKKQAYSFKSDENLKHEFIASLPFTLTTDQITALAHIEKDTQSKIPMNRLILGDVGSGKTVLAAYTILQAYKNGYSSVLMAPTQILANQHFESLTKLLAPFSISISLITASHKQQNDDQKAPIVLVGTHALLEESVMVDTLGLVIIDEQQRFGVKQRSILQKKSPGGHTPHFLTTTATPIPRTIALTLYGNLDVSVLNTLPTGRLPIKTWVVPKTKRSAAYEWIQKQIEQTNQQAFIVCPFIEPSENIQSVRSAREEFNRLATSVFSHLPLALVHGNLKPTEKDTILTDFRNGKYKILVATPVVEVGIDIPNATIMMIEGSERFGLAQLHQLRGRVGRSNIQSFCLLFTEGDEQAISRLKILETNHNGPDIAYQDLRLRGEGSVFGVQQHGLSPFALASLADTSLATAAEEASEKLLSVDPELESFPLLREIVFDRTIQDVSDN